MTLPSLTTLDGDAVARLGQGTWRMGEDPASAEAEVSALQQGLDRGLNLIDTAEMYADAERVVGRALRGRREGVFVVTKVLPDHASKEGTIQAAERSLRALGTDVIDLYLLHWPGAHPLGETLEAFAWLRDQGKIRFFGVSNFDASALQAALGLPHGRRLISDQILYNLTRREAEAEVLPLCRDRDVWIMAYSPLEQGRLLGEAALSDVAARHGVTAATVALAWVLRHPHVVTIPKASRSDHLEENVAALELRLETEDIATLDRAFPPPDGPRPLSWL